MKRELKYEVKLKNEDDHNNKDYFKKLKLKTTYKKYLSSKMKTTSKIRMTQERNTS